MKLELDVSLDPTLGCGQAHRWRKTGDQWQGVLGDDVVTMRQTDYGAEVEGCTDKAALLRYFRAEDDLQAIIAEISGRDPYVASLSEHCPGLRILLQDRWECLATYLLATNANVARIGKMVESVCDCFGRDLGPRRAFPTPSEILDGRDRICECRLGFRDVRLIQLADRVESGDIDMDGIAELDYRGCVEALMTINGVGPKVADCVAIFGYGHLEAFPVDVRISKVMEAVYGVRGSYRTVSEYGMSRFGRYAGYAQEFLYHSRFIDG
ncbi:MAG: DNA glycosylase [Thermoplasmata archaeon]|nr:DNA glycosylase [Thermoplasmata archaeon]